MQNEVKELNEVYSDRCYNPACGGNGQCTTYYTEPPSEMPKTACMKPVCRFQVNRGVWDWEYIQTEENIKCVSDSCTYRECRDDEGCHEEDICTNQTNECVTYSCEKDESGEKPPQCVFKNANFTETECTIEVCEDGKKVFKTKNVDEVCDKYKGNLCVIARCLNGKCNYTNKTVENMDLCLNYTCDPKTGEFTNRTKCEDGIYCTEDQCTVFGECKYIPISCSKELDMTNYPCFQARCKEDLQAKTYRCTRKLIQNAFIDVCGNCIIEGPKNENASSSSSEIDLLECAGAPAKPLLTEGLAAATIGLIILGAVVAGAAVTASSVAGAKTLIERSKNANNQSAHSNPLYENGENELSNPAYQDS